MRELMEPSLMWKFGDWRYRDRSVARVSLTIPVRHVERHFCDLQGGQCTILVPIGNRRGRIKILSLSLRQHEPMRLVNESGKHRVRTLFAVRVYLAGPLHGHRLA